MACTAEFPLEDFYAYLDGQLDGERHRSYEAHLEGCSHCSEELSSLRALNLSIDGGLEEHFPLASARRGPVPPREFAQVRRRLLGRSRQELRSRPWVGGLITLSVAAAAVLMVTLQTDTGGGAELQVAVLSADLVRDLARPAIDEHDAFFVMSPRGVEGDGRILAVPSRETATLEDVLDQANPEDLLLMDSVQGLAVGWSTQDGSGDGRPDTLVHESGRSFGLLLADRGHDGMDDLVESYRAQDQGVASIAALPPEDLDQPAMGAAFLRVEQATAGYATVLAVDSFCRLAVAFPFSADLRGYPLPAGLSTLPPLEPVIESLEDGRFLYRAELDRLEGVEAVFFADRNRAFQRTADGSWQPWNVDVLPYPRPLRVRRHTTLVVITAAERLSLASVMNRFGEEIAATADSDPASQQSAVRLLTTWIKQENPGAQVRTVEFR